MSTDIPPLPRGAPDGCWFDHGTADAACAFFPRHLRHTEAEWAGQPFHLRPWQANRLIRPTFGWKREDGSRLIRVVYLEVPRKNGKTELAAGVSLLALLGDGEFGGQGYSMAVDKDQAKIVFNKAGVMVGLNEDLSRDIEVFKTSLFCAQLMASFRPLSSGPQSKHGFSPSFAIGDEIHAWSDGEIADVVHKGTAARRQPLEIYITTAGVKGFGFGWEMHDRAVKVLDGTLTDPTFLPVIFGADDEDDWRDEAVWAKANPNLGVSVKLDFLRSECAKAQESPRLENEFKRYHLNQWTEQVTRWLPLDDWDACAGPVLWQQLPELLAGRRCFAGVDLSSTTDITALVYVFPPELEGEPWHLVPRFFLPEANLERRIKRDRLPYDKWRDARALTLTPGNVVDQAFIEKRLSDDAGVFHVAQCAYDKWMALPFALHMQDEGLTMVEFGQGYVSMSAPCKEFEKLVISRRLAHGGHPMLREMAKAVSVITDPAGNIKPDKGRTLDQAGAQKADRSKGSLRIDGIVASVMGLGLAIVDPGPAVDMSEVILARGGFV